MIGISSGLSFLIISLIDIWLAENNVSKSMIGLFSLAHFPYALKFVLAAFVEKIHPIKNITHKKSWIIISHSLILLGLLLLSKANPKSDLSFIFFSILLIKFGNSFQNITSYSFQIDRVPENKLSISATLFTFGFRLGMFISSYGVLMIAHYYNWSIALFILAVLSAISSLIFFIRPEPLVQDSSIRFSNKISRIIETKSSLLQTITKYLLIPVKSFARHETQWKLILLIIATIKTTDTLCHKMGTLMYLELGFSKAEIANIVKCFGVIATILGGFSVVRSISKKSIIKMLSISAFLHALTSVLYIAIHHIGHIRSALAISIFFENFTGGMFMSAFLAFLYFYSNKSPYPAVMYTFFFGIYSFFNMIIGSISGILAEYMGWDLFFFTAMFIGLLLNQLIITLNKKSSE